MIDAATLHLRMFDALKNRDLQAMRDLYHADYTYMAGDGREQQGVEAGIAVAETYLTAFPDLAVEIRHHHSPTPETSIIELTARGTHQGELEGIAPTGKPIELVVCNVIEARDGRIARESEYYDRMAVLGQLGVVEPTG
jgi:steroid delta-isomerase-like uncharacterized protein